jgi:hypothetical protein
MGKIDYVNAMYQGCIGQSNRGNKPNGYGIIIDDELNFFVSKWKNEQFNGFTYMKTVDEISCYGYWDEGVITGINVLIINSLTIFFESNQSADPNKWKK